MTKLSPCSCGGLLPALATSCPHCARPIGPPKRGVLRGLAATTGGGLIAMTLSACYGAPIEDYSTYCSSSSEDTDRDGYCLAYDCNEGDPTVHAFASDPAGDAIDQNCDGADGVAGDGGT